MTLCLLFSNALSLHEGFKGLSYLQMQGYTRTPLTYLIAYFLNNFTCFAPCDLVTLKLSFARKFLLHIIPEILQGSRAVPAAPHTRPMGSARPLGSAVQTAPAKGLPLGSLGPLARSPQQRRLTVNTTVRGTGFPAIYKQPETLTSPSTRL